MDFVIRMGFHFYCSVNQAKVKTMTYRDCIKNVLPILPVKLVLKPEEFLGLAYTV